MLKYATIIIIGIALCLPYPAHAVTWEQVTIFGKTVACSQLPLGTCEFLNAENARNISRAWAAARASGWCNSSNFSQARQLLDGGYGVPNPTKCRKLLNAIGY